METKLEITCVITEVTRARYRNRGYNLALVYAKKLRVAVALAIWWGAYMTVRPVYAYLDPGAGSFLFQLLIGAAVSALFLLKVYWKKIIGFFTKKSADADDDEV